MKPNLIYIIVIFSIISCAKKDFKFPFDSQETYYLNKDSIEIIEFENNKIFRYFLRDSIKRQLNQKDITFYSKNFDCLTLSHNDSLIYKKITLNTKESIDLNFSRFWTVKYKGLGQEWYSFFENKKPDLLFKSYNSYVYRLNEDTLIQGYYDNGGFKVFDKFNFMFLGSCSTTGCLVSKVNKDSLLAIPINDFSKPTNKAPFFLEPYNSKKTKLHIGKWKLKNKTSCEFNDITDNELIIESDTLYFKNSSKEIFKIKYRLGLDCKYLELFYSDKSWKNSLVEFSEIKVLKIKKNSLKLELNYSGGFCHSIDTLIFQRIDFK